MLQWNIYVCLQCINTIIFHYKIQFCKHILIKKKKYLETSYCEQNVHQITEQICCKAKNHQKSKESGLRISMSLMSEWLKYYIVFTTVVLGFNQDSEYTMFFSEYIIIINVDWPLSHYYKRYWIAHMTCLLCVHYNNLIISNTFKDVTLQIKGCNYVIMCINEQAYHNTSTKRLYKLL